MKKILLSFSFIAIFGLGITSVSFDFSENFNSDKKINLENNKENAPRCNNKKISDKISDNKPQTKACCSKKTF